MAHEYVEVGTLVTDSTSLAISLLRARKNILLFFVRPVAVNTEQTLLLSNAAKSLEVGK